MQMGLMGFDDGFSASLFRWSVMDCVLRKRMNGLALDFWDVGFER